MEDNMMVVDEGAPVHGLDSIISKFKEVACNRTIDASFKGQILSSMALMCKHDTEMAGQLATDLIDSLKDYDSVDF